MTSRDLLKTIVRQVSLVSVLILVACITAPAVPCPLQQGPGCRWHAEYSDGKVVQITTDIWYRTCPVELPKPPARVIPDSAAACEERR